MAARLQPQRHQMGAGQQRALAAGQPVAIAQHRHLAAVAQHLQVHLVECRIGHIQQPLAGRLRADLDLQEEPERAGMFTEVGQGHRRPFSPVTQRAGRTEVERVAIVAQHLQAGPHLQRSASARVQPEQLRGGGRGQGGARRRQAGHAKHTKHAEQAEQQDRPQQPRQPWRPQGCRHAPCRSSCDRPCSRCPRHLLPTPSSAHAPSHRSSHCDAASADAVSRSTPACGSIPE